MRTKKLTSYIMVLALLLIGLLTSIFYGGNKSVNADGITASSLWTLSQTEIEQGGSNQMALRFRGDATASFKNSLPLKNFAMTVSFQNANFEGITFKLTSDAPASSSETSVTNSILFTRDADGKLFAKLNDGTATEVGTLATDISIAYASSLSVGGCDLGDIKEVGKEIVKLTIVSDEAESAGIAIVVKEICTQQFVMNSSNEITSEDKNPVIVYNTDYSNASFYIPMGLIYTLDYEVCDVLSGALNTKISYGLNGSDETAFRASENKKIVVVDLEDKINGDIYKFIVKVLDKDEAALVTEDFTVKIKKDLAAPEYTTDASVISDYQLEVEKAAYSDYTAKKYIEMGSDKYYYLPEVSSLFSDDVTVFDNMKYDLYYTLPGSSETSTSNVSGSSLKIKVSTEGDYSFRLVAIDQVANKSVKSGYFTFSVYNTSGPSITAPSSNDNGFVNTSYTSNSFTISGINLTTTYTLYYRADASAEWKEVLDENDKPVISGLTFTPDKIGEYKITCKTVDNNGAKAEASTTINVNEKTVIIKGDSQWAKNNILSIIFLCTGTLSLIGIIVLLLIKPKEEAIEIKEVSNKK